MVRDTIIGFLVGAVAMLTVWAQVDHNRIDALTTRIEELER